jgi:hypothetical protein
LVRATKSRKKYFFALPYFVLVGSVIRDRRKSGSGTLPPWLYFEPPLILNFDTDEDPDRFYTDADPYPGS